MENRTSFNLRDKFVLYFVLTGMVVLSVSGFISYYITREALLTRTFSQLTSLRIEKKKQIQAFLKKQEILLHGYARSDEGSPVSFTGFAGNVFIADTKVPDSIRIINNNDNDTTEKINGKQIPEIPSGKIVYSDYGSGISSMDQNLLLITREKNKVFILSVPEKSLTDIMYEINPENGLGYSGETYLAGSDLLMRTNSRFQQNSVLNVTVNTPAVHAALSGITGTGVIDDYRGIPVLSSWTQVEIGDLRWALLSEMDVAEVLSPVYELRASLLVSGTVIAIIIFIIAVFISRSIARPILKLENAFETIRSGNLDVTIENRNNDEIGSLVRSFNFMASELKAKNKELEEERMKSIRLFLEGQEEERKRIAREIHDSLGQLLVVLNMRYERLCKSSDATEEQKNAITELIRETISEARRISNDLSSSVLLQLGLFKALQALINSVKEIPDITFQFHSEGSDHDLNPLQSAYIYRIIQESVSNIIKHSCASEASIDVTISHQIHISVRDNGKGFDESIPEKGSGLKNMYDRVKILGGSMTIESSPLKGTFLDALIPIMK
jgi:signal transduction histidine kinase